MDRCEPRRGTPDPKLGREEFRKRFLSQFRDPAFGPLAAELDRIAEAAWDAYSHSRKSPHTRKAGPGFADPEYELSTDWLAAREAVLEAERRHRDASLPLRILLISASSRSEHTCPSEMSKSYRLTQIARETLESTGKVAVDLLELSRLAAEYGRHIHPCKACFSTAPALCHWPCSCYPNYSLGQTQDWMNDIYPLWVAAHGIMIVTPVNWYQVTSPLKLMMDRLVCADGGNPDPTRTHGKDARQAKRIELEGWDYPRHLAGRLFAVVVHGDVAGWRTSAAASPTGSATCISVRPGPWPRSTAISATGNPTPRATRRSTATRRSRTRSAMPRSRCSRAWPPCAPASWPRPAPGFASRGRNRPSFPRIRRTFLAGA